MKVVVVSVPMMFGELICSLPHFQVAGWPQTCKEGRIAWFARWEKVRLCSHLKGSVLAASLLETSFQIVRKTQESSITNNA